MSIFQCFLIIGDEISQTLEVDKLTNNLKINIKKPSVDIVVIEPEISLELKTERHITINQVRALKKHLFQKPIHLSKKVIIMKNAQLLTIEAQNALLKILEEPPKHAIIFMLSTDKKSLSETIVSRVITITTKAQTILNRKVESILLTKDTASILKAVSQLKEPKRWLDDQIVSLYTNLVKVAKTTKPADLKQVVKVIERCAYTKKMIIANVNPKFALYDLTFSLSEFD